MEKGPSTYAEYWTSPYAEVEHYTRHGKQMGFENNIQRYSKAAKDFALKEGNSILSFTANENKFYSTYKYDTKTNEFIIISRGGKIVTYFPPKNGIEYFYAQYEKWGNHWN